MTIFITNYRIFAILVGVALVTGLDPPNQLKICTTANCPNQHLEIVDDAAGTMHRYSKNAANFNEAKSRHVDGASPEGDRVNRLATVRSATNPNQPNISHQFESKLDSRVDKKELLPEGDANTGIKVSVLGDGRATSQKQQHSNRVQQIPHNEHLQQHDNHRNHSQIHQSAFHQQKNASSKVAQPLSSSTKEQKILKEPLWGRAVEEGVYWSATVEGAIPPGLGDAEVEAWSRKIRDLKVSKVEGASLSKCGSNLNKHVVFEDGTTSCARYRHPMVHFVLGDLYCYHLARLLGMQNVPAVVLSWVSSEPSSQWSSVTEDILTAQWVNDTVCSFSLWIENIGKSYLPDIMYINQHDTITPSTPGFAELNLTQMVELAQYSDLIIFDYITCHLDRMTIRKNAVEYYRQDWLYKGDVHNLAKHTINGGLWFIDNENGLFNAYSVAYSPNHEKQMQGYHEELLRSLCIFRRSTAKMVLELSQMENPFGVLNATVFAKEPVMKHLDKPGRAWTPLEIEQRFKQRLINVANWIGKCKSRFSD